MLKWLSPLLLVRSLRQVIAKYTSMPEAPALRHEQASILLHTLVLFATLGSGSATLFLAAFHGLSSWPMLTTYLAVLLLYAILIGSGLHWRRSQDHVGFIHRCVHLLFLLGIAWGMLVNLFAMHAKLDQQGILVGLVMTLVAAPMLGVPLSAALAFFVPITVACSIVIMVVLHPIAYEAVLSFLGFLVFALTGLISMNKTIMDRLVARLNLEREHEIVRVFLREYEEVSSDWIWEIDDKGRLREIVPPLCRMLPPSPEQPDRMQLFDPALRMETCSGREAVLEAIRDRVAFRDRTISVATHTGTLWLSITGHPVYDSSGEFQGYRGIGSDVTAAHLDRQRIEFLARHDGLTRLLSRKTFVAEADALLACRPAPTLALVLIDLDDFKQINDDFGHVVGDTLLETVADRLNAHLLQGELASRIGGDEFALLLSTTGAAHATARAAELAHALRIEVDASGSTLPSSASIGVAIAPGHGGDTDQLMRRADLALYATKNRGKGAACLFEAGMETEHLSRLRLLGELGSAIEQQQIFLDYQPIVDIASGQLISAEALVRWRHPTRGILAAGEFVLAAESSDLIEPLGEHVLLLACRAAMQWENSTPVSVNLSPRQLRSGRFVPILKQCLASTGLPPGRLTMEVTETVFLDATNRVIAQLGLIRELGVRLVLDDFGTGYSSLTYLHRFEVDGIKIDASFMRDLASSRKVGAIVRTIGRLASDMNMYVTAEGVETEEQLSWLRGNGIAFAQGYLLGRPDRDPRTAMETAAAVRAGSGMAARPTQGNPERNKLLDDRTSVH